MKINIKYKIISLLLLFPAMVQFTFAGNPDRVGQAGAGELLINPWSRSSGWGSVNTASITGVEAIYGNVAGIAFTRKLDVNFSYTQWLKGSGININSVGLTAKAGESGAFGLSMVSMNFGDIKRTSYDSPEGGIGTYSPQFTTLSLSYAKEFSHSIYGGLTVKGISEAMSDISAQGLALDAGIQYVTGKTDNLKFGITLKNVGPTMKFSGDGLGEKISRTTSGNTYDLTLANKGEQFELPSALNIGAAYDYKLSELHRLTAAVNFTSNSFSNDQYMAGLEYGFRNYLMVRAGYTFNSKDAYSTLLSNAYTGPSAGLTVELPLGKSGRTFGFDYSFRATENFNNTHTFGARLTL